MTTAGESVTENERVGILEVLTAAGVEISADASNDEVLAELVKVYFDR